MEKEIKAILLQKLSKRRHFTTSELKNILHKHNSDVSKSAHSWWIHKLKKEGFLTQLGRGIYTFQDKKDFEPKLTHKAKQFYNKAKQYLPESSEILMYENYSIAEIIGLPKKNHYIFIHVPKEHIEMFFYDIIHLGKRIFIKPSKEVVELYITPYDEAFVLYPLLKQMPLVEFNNYTTLSIEGLLVHSVIFGHEYYKARDMDLKEAYKIIFNNYNVNTSKLLRYAARRERKKEVVKILTEIGII
jgi:hypothetical protein